MGFASAIPSLTAAWGRATRWAVGAALAGALLGCGGGGSGSASGGSHPAPPAQAPLGVGLEGVTDWAKARMFADLVKGSRRFGSPGTPWDEAAPVDAQGWPTADFGVVLWTGMDGQHGYGGTYRVSYKGPAGVVASAVASAATFGPVTRNATTGVCTQDMTVAEGQDQLMVAFTGTGGGLRDLAILRPGEPSGQVFGSAFLGLVRPFQVLRCMDVLHTNNNPVVTWGDRAQSTDAQWSSDRGVPWEVLFQLSKETGKDLWVNIPHQADDAYLHQLALLAKAQLPAGRALYVEYSNEVWNWQFDQAHWAFDRAGVLAAAPGSPLTWDGETNPGYWHWRFVALRLKQVSDAFRAVFGDSAMGTRIRPVLAGQIVQPPVLRTGLEMIQGVYGAPKQFFYGVAGAPYFNLGDADLRTDLTEDDVIAALSATVASMPTACAYDENVALGVWYGLPFLAYEGGPDTFGPNNAAAKLASASDPRMQAICATFLNDWYAHGFSLFNWFTLTSGWGGEYGTWGLTQDPTVTSTPKLEALRQVLAAVPPPVTNGALLPVDLDARAWIGNGNIASDPYLRWMHEGEYRAYLVRVPAGGSRTLVIESAALAASQVAVAVDGQAMGTVTLGVTGGETWQDQAPLALVLQPGLHVLRLTTVVDGGFAIRTLRLR